MNPFDKFPGPEIEIVFFNVERYYGNNKKFRLEHTGQLFPQLQSPDFWKHFPAATLVAEPRSIVLQIPLQS